MTSLNTSPFIEPSESKYIPLEPVLKIVQKLHEIIENEHSYILEEIWEKLVEKKADDHSNDDNSSKPHEEVLIANQDLFEKIFYPGFFKKSVKEAIKSFLFGIMANKEKFVWGKYSFLGNLAQSLDDDNYNLNGSLLR